MKVATINARSLNQKTKKLELEIRNTKYEKFQGKTEKNLARLHESDSRRKGRLLAGSSRFISRPFEVEKEDKRNVFIIRWPDIGIMPQ